MKFNNHSMTEKSFMRNKTPNFIKHATMDKSNKYISKDFRTNHGQNEKKTKNEYSDSNYNLEKLKKKIKVNMKRQLVNGDVKSLKSIKSFLSSKFKRLPNNNIQLKFSINNSPLKKLERIHDTRIKREHNLSVQVKRPELIEIENEEFSNFNRNEDSNNLNDEITQFERKTINLEKEANSFAKLPKYLKLQKQ
mmetsp:Transcript_18470/g.16346  ORF Transcript_18470/g.16346 Transcript_18470/m.16346 type:complete len:193 (+) Transcript_18470:824-1402(+)